MKVWTLFCLTLFCAASTALGAQPPAKKKADNPPARSQPARSQPDKEDGDAKPAKKAAKKGLGLKIAADGEAELIKTLSYMQGYGFGQQIVQQFNDQGIELDKDTLFGALTDALEGKEASMTDEEMRSAIPEIHKFVEGKMAVKNKKEGEDFLAANKKKEGVKTLPSGLQYKVLNPGRGETPKKADTVTAHYKGTLVNGTEFDSSYKRGSPASFAVGQVIPGWTEALQRMKVGDKWELFIPSDLAYGPEGRPGAIPPNATLIFEVELLGVKKGGAAGPSLK